jgi:hypothetical protein
MNKTIYHFQIKDGIFMSAAKDSLLLSIMAAESLFGRPRINLEARFRLERVSKVCIIDIGTKVGETIARVFTGLMIREFGEQAFKVEKRETTLEVITTAEELETVMRDAQALLCSDPGGRSNRQKHKHSKKRKRQPVRGYDSDNHGR